MAGFLLLGWGCGHVERDTRLRLSADTSYAAPSYISRGCDGQELGRQGHALNTGALRAHLEHANGFVAQAVARGVLGRQLSASGDEVGSNGPLPRHYKLGSLGLSAGYDWKHVGVEVGVSAVADGHDLQGIPMAQLRAGNLDRAWLELTAGTLDPLYFTRIMGVGVGARFDQVRARLAFVGFTHIVNADPDRGSRFTDDPRLGAEAEISLRLTDTLPLSLDLGTVIAANPSGRLGLTWLFGGP